MRNLIVCDGEYGAIELAVRVVVHVQVLDGEGARREHVGMFQFEYRVHSAVPDHSRYQR